MPDQDGFNVRDLRQHDTNDQQGNPYGYTDRLIEYGREMEIVADSLVPALKIPREKAATFGPIGQWFKWPAADPAVRGAQWGQAFPALLTTTVPPKATPLKQNDWTTLDTTLAEIAVGLPAGTTPAASMPGVVVQGTALDSYQPCFVPVGGGSSVSVSPAKIALQISPTVYQVDIYDNDFSSAPTMTAVTAEAIDLDSVAFPVGKQVAVFKDGATYYILTSMPWIPNTLPPVFDGRVTANLGAGSYSVRQTTGPFPADTVFGPTLTAKNYGASTLVLVGMDVPVFTVGAEFRIWCPLGDCS